MHWAFEKWWMNAVVFQIELTGFVTSGVKMMYKAHYLEKDVAVPIVEIRRFHSIMPTLQARVKSSFFFPPFCMGFN
jgi:hypothetical protein